ncbi:bacteriocin [Streptococcus chenjunshii]|uniref:Bacteriocin n=1 Tax=Streptococcus chenjunshii TaxID=2173853 RepID=A0A372KM61_9STRE|nr:bacteriocin [Streptococcus chenjunshii]AXQ79138.1 bacteriocin [Streptococcus chenjunshii]RFU50971.1 bacteriocin [Streptococcus chenjunshii]RFU53363.1 bacteriocin [Streptococcus chenjunshii]
MTLNKFNEISNSELELISGGGKIGAAVGGCLGGMLLAWAGGPVSATGYAVVCGTSAAASAYFN